MILIATDSFKDALPAIAVCQAIANGVNRAAPDLPTQIFPLADGGEGTAEILSFHHKSRQRTIKVHDPLFRPIKATYSIAEDGASAFIEMAAASGLQLLEPSERNPLQTTSFGTGELIADAIEQGAKKILLGIGGSATNDGGIGMATALGFRFLDRGGQRISPVGAGLPKLTQIDPQYVVFNAEEVRVTVICDVDNPLYGPNGAAYVYGPQKGATAQSARVLDEGLQNLAIVLQQFSGKDFSKIAGAGAAGGMGAGTMAFLGATLQPGIETVMQYTGFEMQLKKASLVITGEGRIDAQTLRGKLIAGVTRSAARYQIPVIALCGSLEATPQQIEALGLQAAFSITPGPISLDAALAATAKNLENTSFNLIRTFNIPGKRHT